MKFLFISLSVSALLMILTTCGEKIIGPEHPSGRRDYIWTVDTLNPGNESLYLMRIWGSSPTDIWAVGASSYTATTIWHYNGKQWRCDSIPRGVQPCGLYGFASYDVWMGNTNSTIWHYNGVEWKKHSEQKLDDYEDIIIQDFAGRSKNDFYAVGGARRSPTKKYRAVILKFEYGTWRVLDLPDLRVGFGSCSYDSKNDILVITGIETDPKGFKARVFYFDGKSIVEQPITTNWEINHVVNLSGEIFVSAGSKIFTYKEKELTLWKDNTNTFQGIVVCGRNRNDLFVSGLDGIYHYNGINFENIYKKNFEIWSGIVFENEIFFNGYVPGSGKSLIVHGRLK